MTCLGLLLSLVCLCLQAGHGHSLLLKNMKRHRRAAECVIVLPSQQGTVLFPDPAVPSNDNCVYRVNLNGKRGNVTLHLTQLDRPACSQGDIQDNLLGFERCGSGYNWQLKNVIYVDFSFRDVGQSSLAMSFSVSSNSTGKDRIAGLRRDFILSCFKPFA
ncbi:uncharacterized protein LOC112575961 [Pomacea canaliculata]|uniref:uncharacterized protein LOC112575961 n=1 Tax=Pomacea canaliculata TaxID=400727 RepID=UPI000D73CE2C|nr:uncharacterized protein LOC112575961 [Pomacea canaliculata]